MRLSGRAKARPARRERKIAKRARGAPALTHHGPLQPMVRLQYAPEADVTPQEQQKTLRLPQKARTIL
jgi:hypothetical protein